jgi:ABC-2 type transport system permease protein
MNKIFIIIEREYVSRVFTKSFLLTTLLAPLGFVVLIVITIWINTTVASEKHIAVIDESKVFAEHRWADAENRSVYFFYPDEPFDSLYAHIQNSGKDAKYDAILRIPEEFDVMKPNRIGIQLFSADRMGVLTKQFIHETIQNAVRKKKLEQLSIDRDVIEQLDEKVIINYTTGVGNEETGYTEVASLVGYLIGFIIYLVLLVYGTMIMRGVKEEKTNRIIEVLVSSVRPFQLMLGKIVGIGLVGLTQFVLWAVLILVSQFFITLVWGISLSGNMAVPTEASANVDLDELQILMKHLSEIKLLPLTLTFLFFFVGGFLLYGALFAAVGAAVNDDAEMQTLTLPVSIPIIISIILLNYVLGDPDGSIAFWASVVPFSSPIIMPSLMAFQPPLWQLWLSAGLLVIGFLMTTWFAARIYRTGILMYGKKVSLREILRWGWKG